MLYTDDMIFTEKSAVKFVVDNMSNMSAKQYFTQNKFKEFINLIAQGKEIAAAKKYQEITGCNMKDCHFATSIAKQLSV